MNLTRITLGILTNLVLRAAGTSPSKDSTARSDSRSYLDYLDFDWPKDIQIRTDLTGLQRNTSSKNLWNRMLRR